MKNFLVAAALVVSMFSNTSYAQEAMKVDWNMLNGHVVKKEIVNPFEDMSVEDIRKLQQVAIVNDMIASGEEIGEEAMKIVEQAKSDLNKAGHDIEKLFKIREEIIVQRELELASTNPKITDKNIEMQGFLLPLEFEGKKITEFLLVPYVGACIHEPAPAPNQIVYAKMQTPVEPPALSNFMPIKIKGFMTSESQAPELSLVDGEKEIPTSYSISVQDITFIPNEN